MTKLDIAQQRLFSQGLGLPKFKTPSEVITSLGALQAQGYERYGAFLEKRVEIL